MTKGEERRWKTEAAMSRDPAWKRRSEMMMLIAKVADFKYRTPQSIDPALVSAIVRCGRRTRT